jgi:hypothetical protein
MLKYLIALTLFYISAPLLAQDTKPFDAAAAFGARPSLSDLSLSPDGTPWRAAIRRRCHRLVD